jgi:glutathione S-transferase
MVITVHHLENSRSQRVLWLLEELGLDYEIRRYERDASTMMAPESLRAVHPLGKSPVITDAGLTIAESGAIVDYLVSTYGGGRLVPPAGTAERLRYTFWLHYAEGSAMPPLVLKLVFGALPGRSPWIVKPVVGAVAKAVQESFVDPQIALHRDYWEAELANAPWFAGRDFTAADVQMSFPVEAAAATGAIGPSQPQLSAFLERIHERAAYRRALERGGPYIYAG